MLNASKLPIISHGNNAYSIGGNLFFLGGPGIQAAGQWMSGNQDKIAGGAGIASGLVDLAAPENSLGGGAAKGALSGASMGAALGPWGALAGGAIGGVAGLVGAKKDQNRQERTDKIASMDAYGAMRSNVNPYASGVFAGGGELPGLTQFNEGGRHETSELGGIPQGVSAANGQPNLVEQGETKRGQFIYSDRLPVLDAKGYNLPKKYEGKTFAEASKLASKYIEDRPNDPIAQKGQEVSLNRLKTANEEAIQMKEMATQGLMPEQPQMKMGGSLKNVCSHGGYIFTDY